MFGQRARQRLAAHKVAESAGVTTDAVLHLGPLGGVTLHGHHAAPYLIEFEGLEQRLEVPLAETLIALALDDLEEARSDHVLGEDLQQYALALGRRTINQNPPLTEVAKLFLVPRHPRLDPVVVGVGRVLELHATGTHPIDRRVDVARA